MRARILVLAVVSATALCAQKHKFSWQEACFKNPAAPFCQGAEFFKNSSPAKNAKSPVSPGVVTTSSGAAEAVTPSVIAVGGIDWRFVDPAADAIVGFNFGGLGSSQAARNLIAHLGAGDKLADTEVHKILGALSGMDQVVISVRGGQALVLVTGGVTDASLPSPEPGLKAEAISGNAMLIGPVDAVDQAMRRMATTGPVSELARSAADLPAKSDYWAVGSGAFLGPPAASAGVKRFALAIAVRSEPGSHLALEFNAVPDGEALRRWPAFGTATSDGNAVQYDLTMRAEDLPQVFSQIAASPAGLPLSRLLRMGLNLPVRDAVAPMRTKPVIYGLDDGPKVVKQ